MARTTPAKVEENVVSDDVVEETTEEVTVNRIPEALATSPIFADFCQRYLNILDKIAEYNKEVLAEKDSEWNAFKVVAKAREMANPDDANVKPNETIKGLVEAWESLVDQVNKAKQAVVEATANELGISLSSVAQRNTEIEGPLKEQRKLAATIGQQLNSISDMTTDSASKDAITEFLMNNPLPMIGRDQTRSFGSGDGKATPKYRVTVTITKGDTELFVGDGFAKTAINLSKPMFGYERGKSPDSNVLRAAWENEGNTMEKTVKDPVVFEDNGLVYTIKKK